MEPTTGQPKEGYRICWALKQQPLDIRQRKSYGGTALFSRSVIDEQIKKLDKRHPELTHWAEWTTKEILAKKIIESDCAPE